MELSKHDIRAILLFIFKKEHKARNINETFGEEMTSDWSTRKWFKRFRCGELSLEVCERTESSSVVGDGHLKTAIEKDPRKANRELAKELKLVRKQPPTICMRSENQKGSTNGYQTI
ncbi:histone-lysine N-methyltransferase SETMAR-like [Octopus sinensis]|uniref:Histone-lysine N-methyltransferase SETMAR-like n=1 Tax=Octopus sinensis TaxID=2607531 RepID=A0A6P7T0Q1_9MOLL|nr:histone-lysine N-methyltransferase SETMAR-like [Octopus sinensis]